MDLLEVGPVNAYKMAFKIDEASERKFLMLAKRRKKKPFSSRRKPQSACAMTSEYPDARLHVSKEHRDIRMIQLRNRFRTAPDSEAHCSG